MAFGILYTRPFNPRSTAILAVAKASNLPLDLVTITSSQQAPEEYLKLNPLGKIPTFVGANGFILSECIAIAIYITSQDKTTPLLGSGNTENHASILRWMSFANSEILPSLGGWFNPLIGRSPFVQEEVELNRQATLKRLQIIEDHLAAKTTSYLVGETLSLADLFVAGIIAGAFRFFLDGEWRGAHPACTKWFLHVYEQPIFSDVAGRPVLAEEAMANVPPGKRGE
ncbi:elongation factor EF-1 gamma subunit [Podospora bellae-mahoneyi]|uniref:Dehydrogenase/reductase involved in aflatoxin biosynthesis orthologous to A. nidulans stcT, member of the aflatoxin cluster n=2 Tax=Podospora TaxID=5144 RepID=A0A090CDI2_PODAN|nr:elongation factor EF-1 gamma subunit [Podospora bellae-mahoneyi]CDP25740.1 Putative dehydrogenase/reductase involved in aflatoxin biosynthesis orthologous to A. nidulans stcT, member of the aflatoxin cluster [Podospora anserina S mat+]